MNQPVEINAATELYTRLTQQAALRQLSIMDLFHGATTLHSMQQRAAGGRIVQDLDRVQRRP